MEVCRAGVAFVSAVAIVGLAAIAPAAGEAQAGGGYVPNEDRHDGICEAINSVVGESEAAAAFLFCPESLGEQNETAEVPASVAGYEPPAGVSLAVVVGDGSQVAAQPETAAGALWGQDVEVALSPSVCDAGGAATLVGPLLSPDATWVASAGFGVYLSCVDPAGGW
jgi:hypothetical protein